MGQDYRHANASVSLINYHFAWIPKYRRKVLDTSVEIALKEAIHQKATRMDCNIVALEVMSDHIHLFLNCPPRLSPSFIAAQIKGYTAKALRGRFPRLARLKTLWAPSYFVSTAGNVSSETIQRYIANQKA